MCKNREAIRLLRVLEVLSSDILPLFALVMCVPPCCGSEVVANPEGKGAKEDGADVNRVTLEHGVVDRFGQRHCGYGSTAR